MRTRARITTPAGAGAYTLVELAIVATILSVMLGSLVLFSGGSAGALSTGTTQAELDAHARRALVRIGDEVLPSGLGVITPEAEAPEGSSELTYRRSAGGVNGRIIWEPSRRFAFAYELGELDDGLDNNGNGLVDEGVIEWTIDAGLASEQTVILCHGVRELDAREVDNDLDDDGDGLVDERGFAVQRVNDAFLRLSLTLERLDGERRAMVRSLETAVQPRN